LPLWKKESLIKEIFNIFQLIHFTILFKTNFSLYVFVVILIIVLIFLTAMLMVYMAYKLKRKKRIILWPIKILKYTLPLFSFGFHGQIFLMFTTVFYCRKKESSTSPYLKCRPEHWFSKIKPVGGIAMFLHFLIAFITNTLYYKPIFIHCKSDLLKKSNSLPDIILLFSKMIIITIFILDKGVESEHWAILSFLVFVTGANAYFTLYYKNRQNKFLLSLNNFFSAILFIGFLILLISKIFKFLDFDGSIFLFFSSSLVIIIYIIFYQGDEMNFISQDFRNIYNPDEYLQYVNRFYNYITQKNNSRHYSINLKSLISSIEENCFFQFCPLKKYLMNLEKGLDFENLLLEYCEILFQYGITKFNGNIFLKNHYSIFLLIEMKNIKKALIILESINEDNFSLQTNYNIFRCRKIIENYTSPFINKNNFFFEYRKNSIEFKINLKKAATLYHQFMSLILENKGKNSSNFEEINKIGYNIIKLNKKIELVFEKLIQIKTNNIEIIKLYSEYIENILKNKEKAKKCKELKRLLYNNIIDNQEKDYSNFNLEILKDNYNSHYLIISSRTKKLGIILDCSINLCNIFGYQKKDLIGSHINILIPEIIHKKHNIIIAHKTEEFKLNFLEGLYKNKVYSPNFIEKDVFCLTKSKYLIPINMKVYLVNTEENELVYIDEITPKISPKYDLSKKINNEISKSYVLTDRNFLIQSFTPDCLNTLNLNYESINSNYNIFNFIKDFRNDYFDAINNTLINRYSQIRNSGLISSIENLKLPSKKNKKSNIPKSVKQKIINDIFNQKYNNNKKCRIKWRIPENDIITNTKIGKSIYRHSSIIKENSNITYINNEKELYMEVDKIILNNDLIGYSFKFTRIFNYQNKFYLKSKVLEIESSNKEIQFSKVKKYEFTFKSVNNENNFSKIINNLKKKQKRNSLELMVTKGRGSYKEEDNEHSLPENSPKKHSKYCSTQDVPDLNDGKEITITEFFIPNFSVNFKFNIANLTYELSNDIEQSNFNESIRKEASEKINIFNKLRQKLQKKEKSFESFISSNNSESESEAKISSSGSPYISNTNSNSDSDSISQKNKESKINEETSKKIEVETIQEKNNLNDDNKSKYSLNKNKYDNDLLNNCYKVNLDNIYFMKYDFFKDSIVEEKNKITKIDEIKNCIKKKTPLCVGKDEKYPFISIKINKKQRNSQNPQEKKEKSFSSNNFQNMEMLNEDIIIEKKINDVITNYKDEPFIKRLKKLAFISYVLLIICGIINIRYCLYLYSTINEAFKLTHVTSDIKIYEEISIYYVRELTLLNFNIPIKGGEYINFPARDKQKYISYIKAKLKELFLKNQSSVKKLFSSAINLSENSEKKVSELLLDIKITKNNNNIINSDVYSSLLQYNNAFYSLAFSTIPLDQNHADIFNYIYNNFNNYKNGINALTDIYGGDYDYKKKASKVIIIIILVVMFIIFMIIYILGVKFFLSANKKRINYLNIFYNINSEALRDSIAESFSLIKKLKESKDKIIYEEQDFENSLEDSNSISVNKKNNKREGVDKRKSVYVKDEERNHRSVSNINIAFIIIYGILIIFFYHYFYHNWSHLIDIIKTIDNNIQFAVAFQLYQIQIIDMFNVYREYLFDNETMISNLTQLEYMRKIEDEIYDSIWESNLKTNIFIEKLLASHNELIEKLVQPFCSYFETDYFNSMEECSEKFGIFVNYNFDIFANYFLEELKVQKNFAKYKFENEKIKGNLSDYNISNIIKEFDGNEENITFRLDLFNNEDLHSRLNLLFINSLLPHLRKNRDEIFKYIYVDGEESFFNGLYILYLTLMTIIYLGLFCLIIKILNSQIYKAKIILSIVPIKFLSSQNKIKLLLNII